MIRDFEYFAPKTLKEALTLLDKYQDECKVIAGGQSLLILMRQGLVAPKYLIDIKGISELSYIKSDAKKGLRIGALTTHRAIEKSPKMRDGFVVLAEMENRLASIQTRNWGTIGGNLCHADPAGDPAPVLMALNATLSMAGVKGKRNMPVEDFCLDYFETALEPGELLTEIQVPADNLLKEAGEVASTEAEPISDIYASEEYRRELVKVLVKRVGKEALARAKQA